MRANLSILLVAALAACQQGRDPYTRYGNENTGERQNLTFGVPGAQAVGQTAAVVVTREKEGTYECATYTGWFRDHVECRFIGTVSPVVEISSARCEGTGCSVAVEGGSLKVTGTRAGTFHVLASARLSDGTVLDDSTQVFFAAPDAIDVTCTNAQRCPGPHAALAGATFDWRLTSSSRDLGTLVGPVEITSVQPQGVVSAVPAQDALWGQVLNVRALSPGVATVTLRAGQVERRVTVRVAGLEEVVSGTMRLASSAMSQGSFDVAVDIAGDAAPRRQEAFPVFFVPVWTLRDGTTAVGAAARVTASAGAEIAVPGNPDRTDLSVTVLMVGGVTCRPGRIDLSARLGNAALDFDFDQVCSN